MRAAEVPDGSIQLERSTEREREKLAWCADDAHEAQLRRWREACEATQAAVTAHTAATETNRYELEQAAKKAVRHAPEGPAGE
ncbi:hypothetical protein JK359_38220 [Streptomyces actinomycinicus]|uniref:Uncharacterized protein n=1 Tax=Streptomyces actinomycinicus TaxID=1695166 RepID=A0A937JSP6_9ACTN|nr:hypothetical protein [Streptomyces actinomycinicus]MBL1087701.1 hypothetical protein [Streptomyces actinomycinicus]